MASIARWTNDEQRSVAKLVADHLKGKKDTATENEIATVFFKVQELVIKDKTRLRDINNWKTIKSWLIPFLMEGKPIGKQSAEKPTVAANESNDALQKEVVTLRRDVKELQEMVNLILKEKVDSLPIRGVNIVRNGVPLIENIDIVSVVQKTNITPIVIESPVITPQYIKPPKSELQVVEATPKAIPHIVLVGIIDGHIAEVKRTYKDLVNFTFFTNKDSYEAIANGFKRTLVGAGVILIMPRVNGNILGMTKHIKDNIIRLQSTSVHTLIATIDKLIKEM